MRIEHGRVLLYKPGSDWSELNHRATSTCRVDWRIQSIYASEKKRETGLLNY